MCVELSEATGGGGAAGGRYGALGLGRPAFLCIYDSAVFIQISFDIGLRWGERRGLLGPRPDCPPRSCDSSISICSMVFVRKAKTYGDGSLLSWIVTYVLYK